MGLADWFSTCCSNLQVQNDDTISARYKAITRRLNTDFWTTEHRELHCRRQIVTQENAPLEGCTVRSAQLGVRVRELDVMAHQERFQRDDVIARFTRDFSKGRKGLPVSLADILSRDSVVRQIGGWLSRLACQDVSISSRQGRFDQVVGGILTDASEVQATLARKRDVPGARAMRGWNAISEPKGLPIERLTHLLSEAFRTEWFVQEYDSGIKDAMMNDGFVGVPGHVNDLECRPSFH